MTGGVATLADDDYISGKWPKLALPSVVKITVCFI